MGLRPWPLHFPRRRLCLSCFLYFMMFWHLQFAFWGQTALPPRPALSWQRAPTKPPTTPPTSHTQAGDSPEHKASQLLGNQRPPHSPRNCPLRPPPSPRRPRRRLWPTRLSILPAAPDKPGASLVALPAQPGSLHLCVASSLPVATLTRPALPRPAPARRGQLSPPCPPVLAPRLTSGVLVALSRGNREKHIRSVFLKAFLSDILLIVRLRKEFIQPDHTSGALLCWTRFSASNSPGIKQPLLCMVLETHCSEAFWSGSSDPPFTSLRRTCLLFHVNG